MAYYAPACAEYVVDFLSILKHSDGEFSGQPFLLLPWQKDAISKFYGTLRSAEDTRRQYQYLYLEIPKKNGKSELAAGLGIYHLIGDGEQNGEIYICAADKENAGIIFRAAVGMVEQSPYLNKRLIVRRSRREIFDPLTGTFMRVMSADAYSKHGYKPSCVIFDELHAQPNRELWDIMTFGAGAARRQPVWIVLTTAGDDPDRSSIGWEIHEKAARILQYNNGDKENGIYNPVWLPIIYGMPDDEEKAKNINIYDEALWYAINPSLGHTIDIDMVRMEALEARNSEAAERLFRWLRLNQWISYKTVGWLPVTLFDKTNGELPDLKGKKCYGGLDLSSTTDLTAFVLLFPPQEGLDGWYALFRAYITDEKLAERIKRDHQPFDRWVKAGFVNATPGDVIDFDFVTEDIVASAKKYRLLRLGVDPYLSRMMTQQLMQKNIDVVEIPQNMVTLSPAMKEIERKLREQHMKHEENPCARWCFGNVKCAVDGNGNIKPMKNKSYGRIDVAVAWIIAMATAMLDDGYDLNEKILSDDWSL